MQRRWTVVLLRELIAGSTRFNELRRGVPRMSPALLSQRLKELEAAGILIRKSGSERGVFEYQLTATGRELGPIVQAFSISGQRFLSLSLAKVLSIEELQGTSNNDGFLRVINRYR